MLHTACLSHFAALISTANRERQPVCTCSCTLSQQMLRLSRCTLHTALSDFIDVLSQIVCNNKREFIWIKLRTFCALLLDVTLMLQPFMLTPYFHRSAYGQSKQHVQLTIVLFFKKIIFRCVCASFLYTHTKLDSDAQTSAHLVNLRLSRKNF